MNRSRNDLGKAWIAAALWLGLIAVESSNLLSAANDLAAARERNVTVCGTESTGHPTAELAFGLMLELARKIGHVVGYGILSFLLFRAWRATLPSLSPHGWSWKWSWIAILMTALVASLDEWHQSFLASRTGAFSDVVLDTVAGIGAQMLIYLLLRGLRLRMARVPSLLS